MSIISWHEMIEICKNMVEACHFAWLCHFANGNHYNIVKRTDEVNLTSIFGCSFCTRPDPCLFARHASQIRWDHLAIQMQNLSSAFSQLLNFSARCANLFPMEKRPTPTRLAHLLLLAVATVCCTGFVGGIVRIRPQPSSDLHVDEGAKCQ